MRMRSLFISSLILFFFVVNAQAGKRFTIDRVHSYLGFSVKHMVVSTVKGHFTDFNGTIDYDESDITKSSVQVSIKTASINTNNERRDNHLRSDDFFNAEKFPEITFVSKKIVKTDNGYVAVGDLTIRDVTKEVEIPFEIAGIIKDPRGNERLGVDAYLTINRRDFGVNWSRTLDNGGLVVSDEVKLELHVEAVGLKEDSTGL